MADTDSKKFRKAPRPRLIRHGFRVIDPKECHRISEPEIPGFRVVGGHAQAMLGSGMESIEEVGVHPNACGDDEVAGAGLPFEIVILDAAESYAARCGGE